MGTIALRDKIIRRALDLGADDAGVCRASDLMEGADHALFPTPAGIGEEHSIVVFALAHPFGEPSLDYFHRKEGSRFGNSEGNRRLMEVSRRLGQWLEGEGIPSRDLHYYVDRGGVFLKGAAVLAGLGTIGVNNLLIHPGHGARIRLRAHLVEVPVAPSSSRDFDPCTGCSRPCLSVCPEGAFSGGGYVSEKCQKRLDSDFTEGAVIPGTGGGPAAREARCCRRCEFACSYLGTAEALPGS